LRSERWRSGVDELLLSADLAQNPWRFNAFPATPHSPDCQHRRRDLDHCRAKLRLPIATYLGHARLVDIVSYLIVFALLADRGGPASHRTPVLQTAGKSANIYANSGFIWGMPAD
jgi:hypothetical protein